MRFLLRYRVFPFISLLVFILISACSTYYTIPEVQAAIASPMPVIPGATEVLEIPQEIVPAPTSTIELAWPTATSALAKVITSAPTSTPASTQTAAPVFTPTLNMATVAPTADQSKQLPLEITFPTESPSKELNWRPPLYPIPWAISEHDHFYFSRPISANTINWPVWNYRYGGTYDKWEGVIHTGIDIDAPLGTPVRAAAPGRVVWAGYGVYAGKYDSQDPYGIAVTLEHDFGFQGKTLYSIYAHMGETYVQPNQMVNAGDIIGIVGETGATTGPHLHFEVRWKENMFNSTLNPELWLAPPQGWGVLAGRVMNTSGSFYTSQDIVIERSDRKQTWIVRTYGDKYVHSDPYYRENLVLSDLPAGDYVISIDYEQIKYKYNITINPGTVNYFRFQGKEGFYKDLPKVEGFSPAPGG
jgi:murein DD-endopeptidase MepM/ murein hydrolase activator NlpD